jgi:CheY-like chemotaxis protein
MSRNPAHRVPSARAEPRPLRILCVDDHQLLRHALARMLTFEGHSVRHAGDGHEAWEQIAGDVSSVDVIITDHRMPRMNGVSFVQRVRRARFRGRIIVHSAALSASELLSYRRCGIDAFIAKGNSPDALLTAVTEARAA